MNHPGPSSLVDKVWFIKDSTLSTRMTSTVNLVLTSGFHSIVFVQFRFSYVYPAYTGKGEENELNTKNKWQNAYNTIIRGICKVRNEIKTERNETKRNWPKRNEIKRNEMKQNETKSINFTKKFTKWTKTKRNQYFF